MRTCTLLTPHLHLLTRTQAHSRWRVWQDLDAACKSSAVDVVQSLLAETTGQFDLARRLTLELDLDKSLLKVPRRSCTWPLPLRQPTV